MKTLFCLFLLTAAPSQEVTVEPNEKSLAQVAKRTLGDAQAAEELKALNQLSSDAVTPGAKLRLPGPDRNLALSALAAARNAVAQAGADPSKRDNANARIKEAQTFFRQARYAEAAKAADNAWQLLSQSAAQPTRFAVEVAEDGKTRVSASSGKPVRVEAQGVTQPVYAGQFVNVVKGKAPSAPELPAVPPDLVAPADNRKLHFKGPHQSLGPVALSWTRVNGAHGYIVEVLALDAKRDPIVLSVARPEAKLPLLPAGRYAWSVRTVKAEGEKSLASPSRAFELAPEALKLEVKGKGFQ